MAEEWSPSSLISKALASDMDPGVFSVLNEDDIPKAKNFAEFCLGKKFLNVVPYPRQLQIGLGLFEDHCPSCTNPDWVHGEEKTLDLFDQPISEILDNVQFLEFGKCPKCGSNRTDFVKKGYFHNPTELAACCGQRCVTGETLVLTDRGLARIDEFVNKALPKLSDRSGNLQETTKFFNVAPEYTYRVNFSNGTYIEGTKDHPILTNRGFVKLSDIKQGDEIPISFGQNIWGNKIASYDDIHITFEKEFEEWRMKTNFWKVKNHDIPRGKLSLEDAMFLGYWVSEGSAGAVITNKNPKIRDLCIKVLNSWFSTDLYYHNLSFGLRTEKAKLWMSTLLGYASTGTSVDKKIPAVIKQAPREYVIAFLSALYDGDGNVGKSIDYDTISPTLAMEVFSLLSNLGIPSKIYNSYKSATNGTNNQIPVLSYRVVIEGPAVQKFQEIIGFNIDYKIEKTKKLIEAHNNKKLNMPYWYEKAPFSKKLEFIKLVKKIQKCLHENVQPLSHKARVFGLRSALGRKGVDLFKRMKAENVALSKTKIKDILYPLLRYKYAFTEDIIKEIEDFLAYAESNDAYATVKSIVKSDSQKPTYDFHVPGKHEFWSNGVTSHNSGKSAVTAMIAAYVLHRYLSIPDPINYLSLLSSSQLYMSMTAISAGQAEASLWAPFREYVDAAPWFKDYHQLLQDAGERLGTELLHRPRTFLVYKHKRIVCMYEAPNKRRLRGKTRIFCVSGDTQVTTNLGSFRIEDLFAPVQSNLDRIDKVKDLTVASPAGFEKATHLLQYKNVPGVKIEGEDGTQLTGTPVHPVYIYNPINGFEMKKLGDIRPDLDYLVLQPPKYDAFPTEIPLFNYKYNRNRGGGERSPAQLDVMDSRTHSIFPSMLTTELAELMGFLWAEGSLTKNYRKNRKCYTYRLRFTSSDVYCIERYKKLFLSCFGVEPKFAKAAGESWNLDNQSASICQFMNYLGYEYEGCRVKDVPWPIRKAPKEMAVAFLRSFFDGDGMATATQVSCDLSAPKLAEGIKLLLFNLGILSRICRYTRKGKNYYKVSMYGKNRMLFFEKIGFGLERKHKFSEIITSEYSSKNEMLPIDVTNLSNSIENKNKRIWKTWKNEKIELPAGCLVEMHTLMRAVDDRFDEPEKRMKTVNPRKLSSDFMKNLKCIDEKLYDILEKARDGLYFSKVKSKKDVGNINVYDFTIQPSHLFMANGLVNGNSSVDELGWLEADASKQSVTLSADEISAALDNSLRTVRSAAQLKRKQGLYNSVDAYACNISSPSEKDDKMMRNVRAARTNRNIYACHYPTWEANPTITRESLQSEFDKSRMVAERDFGAVPPLANDPFIDNPNCIDLMIDPKHAHNLIQVKINYHTDDFGNKTKYASVNIPQIDKRKPRMLLVDAGEKRNHFAVMLMTWDSQRNRPRVDYVFDVSPEEGIPINFALMWEHCFQPLIRGLLIKHMFSDTWNSTDLVQNLRQAKVMSEQYSLKFQDFVEIASRLSSGELILPKPELPVEDLRLTYENPIEFVQGKPILTLILQMLTVRQVGRRITKPINGEDDMFRALCLGMYHIVQPQYKKLYAVDAAGGVGGNLGVILSKSAGSAGLDGRKTTPGARIATKRGYRAR